MGNGGRHVNALTLIFRGDVFMKFVVCLCMCLLFGILGYAAEPTNAEHTKIIALENAWNQAQLHYDSKAREPLFSDPFPYTNTDGTVINKPHFLEDKKDQI